jgi:hypothetical protein
MATDIYIYIYIYIYYSREDRARRLRVTLVHASKDTYTRAQQVPRVRSEEVHADADVELREGQRKVVSRMPLASFPMKLGRRSTSGPEGHEDAVVELREGQRKVVSKVISMSDFTIAVAALDLRHGCREGEARAGRTKAQVNSLLET